MAGPMLELLARLLGRKPAAPSPGSLAEELWVAELSGPRRGRFLEARAESYSARYAEGRLELELARPDLFAWTEAPLYQYADFVVEGELSFGEAAPHSACGFLFRYQDESSFYSLLVSNRGFFRLDAVLNGTPRPLVAWTELPGAADKGSPSDAAPRDGRAALPPRSLRLIARGSHFTVVIDERWAAEAVDESFRAGYLAFAGQNYGEGGAASFRLESCFVESRPIEVETWYYRWNYYLQPEPGARRALAETFHAMGEQLAAAVQLRKIERRRALEAGELFLKAEVSLRLGLQAEAEAALDACLELEPGRREAIEEKANILYLRGRSLELRAFLDRLFADPELGPALGENARLACLSGHARFELGDFAGAASCYGRAAELDPEQALFRMNQARAWDQAGRKKEAAEAYHLAARLFFIQEADDDLALALGRLAALRPRSVACKEIRAKHLYRQGKKAEALPLLAELARSGSEDSALHYLLGLALAEKGERGKAIESFARARELEPGFALYAFRHAESLFLAGRDYGEALARALELAPGEGWTNNLAGQAALASGRLDEARSRLEAARRALPGAPEPVMNLAELESRSGRLEAALALLAPFPGSAACRNLAGNALARAAEGLPKGGPAEAAAAREELLERAAREYQAAAALEPGKAEYQENLAAAYLELERYSDAEERIRRAFDLGASARALLLAGNLALVYGDWPRAEAAYRLGLEAAPADPALLAALGSAYLSQRDFKKARSCLEKLREAELEAGFREAAVAAAGASPFPESGSAAGSRAERLEAALLEASTEALACASCGREWRVPRELPAQSSASVRAMPPDDSPAGSCPTCGKIYCIACRKDELVGSRFTCPGCGAALKLSDDRLRYLVREALKRS
ncbi:MAG TPA: tetratricopeptide repeat protein [Spirochaetia bacterium]|nr:tetratricopeptide repeat protein [Spirochaetia bacterium]HRZ65316.1 tetratricopeptide repeat protein [Spirochaetia bacterium]